MVRQAAKWLCTYNIGRSAVDQLHHFSGQEPAFPGLVADGHNGCCHFCQIFNAGRGRKVPAFGKFFVGGASDKLNGFDTQIGGFRGRFLEAEIFCLKVLVVETVA